MGARGKTNEQRGGEAGDSRRSGEGKGDIRGRCEDIVWAPTVGLRLKSEGGQCLNLILVAKEAKPPSYSIICCPGGVRCPMFNTHTHKD